VDISADYKLEKVGVAIAMIQCSWSWHYRKGQQSMSPTSNYCIGASFPNWNWFYNRVWFSYKTYI
jgi:hypothetical protein